MIKQELKTDIAISKVQHTINDRTGVVSILFVRELLSQDKVIGFIDQVSLTLHDEKGILARVITSRDVQRFQENKYRPEDSKSATYEVLNAATDFKNAENPDEFIDMLISSYILPLFD